MRRDYKIIFHFVNVMSSLSLLRNLRFKRFEYILEKFIQNNNKMRVKALIHDTKDILLKTEKKYISMTWF